MAKQKNLRVEVKVTSRRVFWVEAEPDTAPNIGGYYCRVFNDPHYTDECYSASFTLRKELMVKNPSEAQVISAIKNSTIARLR